MNQIARNCAQFAGAIAIILCHLHYNGINGGILNSFTFGVNWFATPNTKVQFNYDFTNRSAVKTVAAGDINSFGTRVQYMF
ncbi:MAG TPA: hypothetical protein VGJ15_09225 [Pirellulales bacterium]